MLTRLAFSGIHVSDCIRDTAAFILFYDCADLQELYVGGSPRAIKQGTEHSLFRLH